MTPTTAPTALLNEVNDLSRSNIDHSRDFNAASLLVRRETDLSRVFGWLLDPRGNHEQQGRFLNDFLSMLAIDHPTDVVTARTRLEVPRFRDGKLVGRIDIQVEHRSFLLLVENKPFAVFGDRQIERYVSSIPVGRNRTSRVVVLLGAGWTALQIGEIEAKGAIVLRLGFEIRDWIERSSVGCQIDSVKSFLQQLSLDLGFKYGEGDRMLFDDIASTVLAKAGHIRSAINIIDSHDKLATRMNQVFSGLVQEYAEAAGLGKLRTLEGDDALFSKFNYGTLRLDIGSDFYDFTIQADIKYFDAVAFGVCLRKETENVIDEFAVDVGRIRQALGPGDGNETEKWWLWWEHIAAADPGGSKSASRASCWAWAAEPGADGLAAQFVSKAAEVKRAIGGADETF